MTQSYHRVSVTAEFLYKVLKSYTRKLEDIEARKNGERKLMVTKNMVCDAIIKDMEDAGLI